MKKFKKFVSVLVCVMLFFGTTFAFSGCGDTKTIDGVTYDTYGLLNINSQKNDNIQYECIIGNVIWGVLLFETVIAPVYFFGFSMYEPVGKKAGYVKGKVRD